MKWSALLVGLTLALAGCSSPETSFTSTDETGISASPAASAESACGDDCQYTAGEGTFGITLLALSGMEEWAAVAPTSEFDPDSWLASAKNLCGVNTDEEFEEIVRMAWPQTSDAVPEFAPTFVSAAREHIC